MRIVFFVAGVPIAQGSAKAFVVNGHANITSTAKGLKEWRTAIGYAAQRAWGEALAGDDVSLELEFRLPRPKSLPKTREIKHVKAPDLDKLQRSCLDAMSSVVYHDDRQVNAITASKRYALSNEQPGVTITIEAEV